MLFSPHEPDEIVPPKGTQETQETKLRQFRVETLMGSMTWISPSMLEIVLHFETAGLADELIGVREIP